MYEDLARSQKTGPLEWLVVNMLMPSLLVTFALHWRGGDDIGLKQLPPDEVVTVCLLPIIEELFVYSAPDVYPSLVRMPQPVYPALMRRAGIEGRVVLKAFVDIHGHIKRSSIVVLQSTEHRFDAPARQSLSAAVFRPARLQGQRIEASITIVLEFTLADHTGSAR
jgi:TonB family protein